MSPQQVYSIARISLSLPCRIKVVPGTPEINAPLAQRTEECRVDAWWFLGSAPVCDLHLRLVCSATGWDYDSIVRDAIASLPPEARPEIPNQYERKPWSEQHRYAQDPPTRHPGIAS
ncbi:MAG: hypothetical protein ACREB9_07450 [Thermoplasmata archaeon]